MSLSDDVRRDICVSRRHCHVGCYCVGGTMMIAFFNKWLRRDVSARPPERHHYVPFHFTGVTFQRADPAALDTEWTAAILKRIASNTFFELKQFE
jgi:hypothetical protein